MLQAQMRDLEQEMVRAHCPFLTCLDPVVMIIREVLTLSCVCWPQDETRVPRESHTAETEPACRRSPGRSVGPL